MDGHIEATSLTLVQSDFLFSKTDNSVKAELSVCKLKPTHNPRLELRHLIGQVADRSDIFTQEKREGAATDRVRGIFQQHYRNSTC